MGARARCFATTSNRTTHNSGAVCNDAQNRPKTPYPIRPRTRNRVADRAHPLPQNRGVARVRGGWGEIRRAASVKAEERHVGDSQDWMRKPAYDEGSRLHAYFEHRLTTGHAIVDRMLISPEALKYGRKCNVKIDARQECKAIANAMCAAIV